MVLPGSYHILCNWLFPFPCNQHKLVPYMFCNVVHKYTVKKKIFEGGKYKPCKLSKIYQIILAIKETIK